MTAGDSFTPLPVMSPQPAYRCPGESVEITRAVHLARLSAFYAKCRSCPHRHETGEISGRTVQQLQDVHERTVDVSPFVTNGIRGVYQNELTRSTASVITEHFACELWQGETVPTVVVGYDERSSSPDLAIGVLQALGRTGCRIVDIGLCTRPCLTFTISHLQADAGIHVTGAGHPLRYTGLDLFRDDGVPVTLATGLTKLQRRLDRPVSRPTRSAAERRSFRSAVPYLAGLWKHFHALRPLSVVCGGGNGLMRRHLRAIAAELPVRLNVLDLDTAGILDRDDAHPHVIRLRETVLRDAADLGVLFGEDGVQLELIDELGDRLTPQSAGQWLAEFVLSGRPERPVVLPEIWMPGTARPNRIAGPDDDIGALLERLKAVTATAAFDVQGRVWFADAYIIGDAVVTLANVLQALSLSDRPFSEVWRSVER